MQGRSSQYVRISDAGNRLLFHFCPDCGATVYYWIEGREELIAIPVGAFGDSGFPAPKFSVYERRKYSWLGLPQDMEHQD